MVFQPDRRSKATAHPPAPQIRERRPPAIAGPRAAFGLRRAKLAWHAFAPSCRRGPSMPQTIRNLAAVLRELGHDCFLQCDVLLCRTVRTNMHVELVGQFLARGQAGVEI